MKTQRVSQFSEIPGRERFVYTAQKKVTNITCNPSLCSVYYTKKGGLAMAHQGVIFGQELNNKAGQVEFLLQAHFPDRHYRCRCCVDYLLGVCAGRQLRGFKAVRRCMVDKIEGGLEGMIVSVERLH
jgi:hypothetical protein